MGIDTAFSPFQWPCFCWNDPDSMIPPSRKCCPAGIRFSVTILGVEKNTIEFAKSHQDQRGSCGKNGHRSPYQGHTLLLPCHALLTTEWITSGLCASRPGNNERGGKEADQAANQQYRRELGHRFCSVLHMVT